MGRASKRWRPLKDKPAKLENWGGGWGVGWGEPDEGDEHPQPHSSLKEEAHNTERHHQQSNTTPKIRRRPVPFVSVGQFTLDQSMKNAQASGDSPSHPGLQAPVIPLDSPVLQRELMSQLTIHESPLRGDSASATRNTVVDAHIQPDVEQKTGLAKDAKANNELFFTDTRGAQIPVNTGYSQPVIQRSQSPDLSDSSDEVIVFSGRGRLGGKPRLHRYLSGDGHSSLQHSHRSNAQGATIINDPINLDASPTLVLVSGQLSPVPLSQRFDDSNHKSQRSKSNPDKRPNRKRSSRIQALEEGVMVDYIANIDQSDDSKNPMNNGVDHGSDSGSLTDNTEGYTDRAFANNHPQHGFDGDIPDLEDIDDLSTSSEKVANVSEVLSKRHRRSGVQYLVVEEGSSVGVARWIPLSSLKMAGAEHHIRMYESKLLEVEAVLTNSDDSNDDRSEGEIVTDLKEDLDEILDERDLWDRRVERMTDEKIARLLSKQEKLGLGSSELLLADGDDNDEDNEDENVDQSPSPRKGVSRNGRRSRRKKNQQRGDFLSPNTFVEELDADNYIPFDIMDLNRPSLGRFPNGHGSRLSALALEDKEMPNSMQSLWENDRAKKKMRKQKREELRAQGLLGKKSKLSTKVTSSSNISIDEIKSDIRNFLLSSTQQLVLAPLKQRERRLIHEIAHVLNLKSKSVGEEGSRFPVLTKTNHTTSFDERLVTALETRFGFRGRKDKTLWPKGAPRERKARGADLRATYQDGEVVGAAAPELGQENKGRAMMEKMGWSKGTALGALHNKGIMQPIPHVVRNTKAGLG